MTAVDPDNRGKVMWVAQAGDELAASNNGFGGAFDGELYFKPLPFADQQRRRRRAQGGDG